MGIADGWPTKIHYICDAYRPCYSIILSVLNSVFAEFDTFVVQLTRVPRSPDLENFVSINNDNDNRTDYFIPCTYVG